MKKLIVASLLIVLTGGGCAPISKPPQQPTQLPLKPLALPAKNVFVHPKFKFHFEIPAGVLAQIDKNGSGVKFVDAVDGVEYATLTVQAGIPGIALPDNKIEFIKLNGMAGHLFHDTDAKTGTQQIDKLIVDMPKSVETIYLAVPVEFGPKFNIKDVIKTWKW